MEPQFWINLAVGLLCGGLGWWLKDLHDKQESLSKRVTGIAIDLPTNYVMKADLRDLRDAIFERFDRLEEKLDRKADK